MEQSTCAEIHLDLTAVIVAVFEGSVNVMTVDGNQLPLGSFQPEKHRTLELALRSWVREQTGMELGYVEQLYTFGNRHRDPVFALGRNHQITVGYLALVPNTVAVGVERASWVPWYTFLPWEDHREGRPAVLDNYLLPQLYEWSNSAESEQRRQARLERIVTAFGSERVSWDNERTIFRYELLYEAGIVEESIRDWWAYPPQERDQLPISRLNMPTHFTPIPELGKAMRQDHRRILASSIGRLRGKLKYRPVVFELLPESFTLLELQRVVEALIGSKMHKQNFRRWIQGTGLVEPLGSKINKGTGRPAKVYRFRRSILAERPAPSKIET
jgi:hypothetical protein